MDEPGWGISALQSQASCTTSCHAGTLWCFSPATIGQTIVSTSWVRERVKACKTRKVKCSAIFFVLVLFLSVGTPLCLQVWTHGAATETVVSETDVNQDLEA